MSLPLAKAVSTTKMMNSPSGFDTINIRICIPLKKILYSHQCHNSSPSSLKQHHNLLAVLDHDAWDSHPGPFSAKQTKIMHISALYFMIHHKLSLQKRFLIRYPASILLEMRLCKEFVNK